MYKILYIAAGAVAIAIVAALYVATQPVDTNKEQPTPFPEIEDRPIDRPTNISTSSISTPSQVSKSEAVPLESAPGSLSVQSINDIQRMRSLLKTAQKIPSSNDGVQYLLLLSPTYDIYIVPNDTHTWIVDVTLKQDPIHYYRMLAEADVAHRINAERSDICGVPFDIHTLPDHPASVLGNLGLQHCGADRLANTEWENYEFPQDN